jgi:hypothetical protein
LQKAKMIAEPNSLWLFLCFLLTLFPINAGQVVVMYPALAGISAIK